MPESRAPSLEDAPVRCRWARTPLSVAYHDEEWGVPVHDDRILFEFLTLEGAQAGLSWETILKKREAYREAFLSFDPERVARFDDADRALCHLLDRCRDRRLQPDELDERRLIYRRAASGVIPAASHFFTASMKSSQSLIFVGSTPAF